MKILPIILCFFVATEMYGQLGDVLPTYQLVSIDSAAKDVYIRSIKVPNDTLLIAIDSIPYAFVSSQSEKDVTPKFRAKFNKKYDLEIRYWEITKADPEYVTLKIAYTKFSRKSGAQKGKYYTIDNLKFKRDEIIGAYIADSNTKKRRFGIGELSLLVLIGTLTLLVGEP